MTPPAKDEYFPAAQIAFWYFRLNGFLGVENFVLHPEDRKQSQKTDADFCGVRFQHRSELGMEDDAPFKESRRSPSYVIAEITRGICKLNGPWIDPNKENIQYVLRAIGAFPSDDNDAIAQSLYKHCTYPKPGAGQEFIFRLIAVGKTVDNALQKRFPHLLQIELDKMLGFIHQRFDTYRSQKANHSQWDQFGQTLWNETEKHDRNSFVQTMIKRI